MILAHDMIAVAAVHVTRATNFIIKQVLETVTWTADCITGCMNTASCTSQLGELCKRAQPGSA